MVSNPKESRSVDKSNLHLKQVRLHQCWKVQPWDDGQVNRHLACVQSTLPVFPSDRRMFKVHCRKHSCFFAVIVFTKESVARWNYTLRWVAHQHPTSDQASTSDWSIFQNSQFVFRSPVQSADEKFMCRDSNDSRLNPVQAALRKHCINVLQLDWNSSVLWFRRWMTCTNWVVSNIAPFFFGWTERRRPSTQGWGSSRVICKLLLESREKAQCTCVLAQAFLSITNPHIYKYKCSHSFHSNAFCSNWWQTFHRTLTRHTSNCTHIHQSVLQFHKWKHYVVNCHLGTQPPPHPHHHHL